jgi:hypothetical protein
VVRSKTIKTLFKGAGPGTHWHTHNACEQGFLGSARDSTLNAIVTHITAYSNPSPYLSMSTSYAIARRYALLGLTVPISESAPGYVYEIDLSAIRSAVTLVDPVKDIASGHQSTGAHDHNGDQNLLAEIARGSGGATPFTVAHQLGGRVAVPAVNPQLTALIFAIRDAEILVYGAVPKSAVVRRHPVWSNQESR